MAHDCGKHDGFKCNKHPKCILYGFLVIVGLIVVIILIAWAVLHATKPQFTIRDATLYNFNVSTNPSVVTSTIQVTITSRNPNENTGIYYDHLGVFATYHNQEITLPSRIPSASYQGCNEVNVWSPFLVGNLISIAPYNAEALAQDQNIQVVDLVIKMTGQVRYKRGAFTSARYRLSVNCPARITFGSQSTGLVLGDAVKNQLGRRCSVSV